MRQQNVKTLNSWNSNGPGLKLEPGLFFYKVTSLTSESYHHKIWLVLSWSRHHMAHRSLSHNASLLYLPTLAAGFPYVCEHSWFWEKARGFPHFLRPEYEIQENYCGNEKDERRRKSRFKKRKDLNICVVRTGAWESAEERQKMTEKKRTRRYNRWDKNKCSLGKVVYCPAVLRCINYRMFLCAAGLWIERQRRRQKADGAAGSWRSHRRRWGLNKRAVEQVEISSGGFFDNLSAATQIIWEGN